MCDSNSAILQAKGFDRIRIYSTFSKTPIFLAKSLPFSLYIIVLFCRLFYAVSDYILLLTGNKNFEDTPLGVSLKVSYNDKSIFIMVCVYFGKHFKIYCYLGILCVQL